MRGLQCTVKNTANGCCIRYILAAARLAVPHAGGIRAGGDGVQLAVDRAGVNDALGNVAQVKAAVGNVIIQRCHNAVFNVLCQLGVVHLENVGGLAAGDLGGQLGPVAVPFIREIKKEGLVTGHGNFPVYIDSPLAIEATRIFKDTDPDCFDEDTRALLAQGIDPIQFPGLQVSVTSDESRMINADRVPKVIISASGMCEAGRIRHHLKHNLWRPECTILFVGYQAVGTLGRTLIDGAVNVKLFGETIDVQAEICQLTGLSGHADREGLLAWVNAFSPKPKRVFVIHGEDEVENIFAQTLTEQGFTACAPYNGEQWAIGAEGAVCLQEGSRVRLEHKPSEGTSRAATVFQRLVSAGKRLLRVIEHNEGGANKDLAKFADQINALCDKWDR